MNKHAVAFTAAVGAPLGFLAGILYSVLREHEQRRRQTIEAQAASIEKLRAQNEDLAYHQRNQWNTIHKLQGDLNSAVSKGLEKQPS